MFSRHEPHHSQCTHVDMVTNKFTDKIITNKYFNESNECVFFFVNMNTQQSHPSIKAQANTQQKIRKIIYCNRVIMKYKKKHLRDGERKTLNADNNTINHSIVTCMKCIEIHCVLIYKYPYHFRFSVLFVHSTAHTQKFSVCLLFKHVYCLQSYKV